MADGLRDIWAGAIRENTAVMRSTAAEKIKIELGYLSRIIFSETVEIATGHAVTVPVGRASDF